MDILFGDTIAHRGIADEIKRPDNQTGVALAFGNAQDFRRFVAAEFFQQLPCGPQIPLISCARFGVIAARSVYFPDTVPRMGTPVNL